MAGSGVREVAVVVVVVVRGGRDWIYMVKELQRGQEVRDSHLVTADNRVDLQHRTTF